MVQHTLQPPGNEGLISTTEPIYNVRLSCITTIQGKNKQTALKGVVHCICGEANHIHVINNVLPDSQSPSFSTSVSFKRYNNAYII